MTRILPLILLVTLCSACAAISQDLSREEVESMYSDPSGIVWYKYMRGTVDEVHPVRMALAYDGATYRGRYAMTRSQEVYDLAGEKRDERILLEEIDHNGLVSGYISGRMQGERFNGEWWSVDLKRSVPIALIPDNLVELKTFKPEVSIITGSINRSGMYMVLTKETPTVVSASVEIDGGILQGYGVCNDYTCQSIALNLSGPMDALHLLDMTMSSDGWKLKLQSSAQGVQYGQGHVDVVYPVERLVSSDYDVLIDCMYPVTPYSAFDMWLEERLTAWSGKVIAGHSDSTHIPDGLSPATRWKFRGYAWIDLSVVNKEVASGMITMYDPENAGYDREAFIFDLTEETLVDIGTLARGSEDLAKLILQRAQTPDGTEGAATYRHISLGNGGFVVRTDFDAVHGDYTTVVPYSEVLRSMRRNALINSVIK